MAADGGPIGHLKRWIRGRQVDPASVPGPDAAADPREPGDVPVPPGPPLLAGTEAPLPPLRDPPPTVSETDFDAPDAPYAILGPPTDASDASSYASDVLPGAPEKGTAGPGDVSDGVERPPALLEEPPPAGPVPGAEDRGTSATGPQAIPAPTDRAARFAANALWMPKLGDDETEWEDAFAIDEQAGRAAIADGASAGIFSRAWSALLAESLVAESIDLADPQAVAGRLDALRAAWLRQIDYPTRRDRKSVV